MIRELGKRVAHGVSLLIVLPWVCSYYIRSLFIGRDRALEGSSQVMALVPGIPGQFVRRAFLACVLTECHRTATIEFGTIFSQAGARIGPNVYIGPRSHIGLAHIEKDVLIAAAVHIPSGRHTHWTTDLTTPIREQGGARQVVKIGAGCWVGSVTVIMADIGPETVVGAGSVVTKPLPPRVVAAGSPARVIRDRLPNGADFEAFRRAELKA